MGADTPSPYLGITLQGTGNNGNNWGAILNESALVPLERRISGNIVRAVTGGTLDLSSDPPPIAVSKVLDFVQVFSGILTSNQIVIIPNLSGFWQFVNDTDGDYQMLIQLPSGPFINIPQGTAKYISCDGNGNLLRSDRDTVGHFEYSAVVDPGFLGCGGQNTRLISTIRSRRRLKPRLF